MKTRFFKVISFVFVLVIIIESFSITTCALSSYDYVKSNSTYYIKNVRSGKYLDVYNNDTSNGTKVIQYQYTGAENQEWKVIISSSGSCKIQSVSSGKYLTVCDGSNSNGATMEIRDSAGGSQTFWIEPNSDEFSARILTYCSSYNKCVVTKGASINGGASAIQYTYNGSKNDQWVFEPAKAVVVANGKNYAYRHYNTHSTTYPNCEYLGGDCANFVSQCMVTSGIHYQNSWYVNKLNETYLTPLNTSELDTTWSLGSLNGKGSPWISAPRFQDYWENNCYGVYELDSNYINSHRSEVYDLDIAAGDVIQIADTLWGEAYHTMYITGYNYYEGTLNFAVSAHTSPIYQKNICQIAHEDVINNVNRKYIFYRMY